MNFRLTLPQPHSRILSLCILFSSVYLWIKPCSSFVNIVLPFSGDSPFSASWATENISFEKTNRKIIKINVTTFYTALLFKLYTHTHSLTFVFFSRYAGDTQPWRDGVILVGFVRTSHLTGWAESRTSTNWPSFSTKASLFPPRGWQLVLAT